jgi:hypothetical protein
MDWYGFKVILVELSGGISRDALHVLLGVFVQLLAAILLRTSVRSPLPWLIVLIVSAANEYYDLNYDHWPDREMQWGESIKDLIVTMTLPTVLLLASRLAPSLLVSPVATEDAQQNTSEPGATGPD